MSASIWIRCLQLLPFLESRGICSHVNAEPEEGSICVFVRWQNEEALQLAERAMRRGCRIVVDVNVNYFDETGLFEGGFGATRERVEECSKMLEVADLVTCASEYLAARASDFHPNAIYLPESVDYNHFNLVKEERDFHRRKLRVIWCGISSKASELEPVLGCLERHGLSLVIISEKEPDLAFPFKFVKWRYQRFRKDVLRGELAISPRRLDTPYNLGHTHSKIGFFMVAGVPAAVSPQPSYVSLLGQDCIGGFLCHTDSDWDQTFSLMGENRELLAAKSKGASSLMEPFSTERVAERYVEVFSNLLGRSEGGFGDRRSAS